MGFSLHKSKYQKQGPVREDIDGLERRRVFFPPSFLSVSFCIARGLGTLEGREGLPKKKLVKTVNV